MISFSINTKNVEETNLFFRKLWCELNAIRQNAWALYPFQRKQHFIIGDSNIGEVSFDYKKKGCIKNLYIDISTKKTKKKCVLLSNRLCLENSKYFLLE